MEIMIFDRICYKFHVLFKQMLNKSGVDGFLTKVCKLSGQQRAYSLPWQRIILNNGGVPTKIYTSRQQFILKY